MNDADIIREYNKASEAIDEILDQINDLRSQKRDHAEHLALLEEQWLKTHSCSCGLLELPCPHSPSGETDERPSTT